MKKMWNAPEMEELEISATQKTSQTGTVYDYLEYDGVEGTLKYSYFGSGPAPSAPVEVTDPTYPTQNPKF